jgi:ribosomal protein S18 acetylase RimI-like enzyme
MLPTITQLRSEDDLHGGVDLLRVAFGTVAKDFGLTEKSTPTNAAFTTVQNLGRHLQNGLTLYGMIVESGLVGCVAIKQAKADKSVYYIERLAVAPDKRHHGYGGQLLSFAIERILERGGTTASIGLMDNNDILKKWYSSKGFVQHECRRVEHLPFKVCFMSMEVSGCGRR